jgi:hypothetical protein
MADETKEDLLLLWWMRGQLKQREYWFISNPSTILCLCKLAMVTAAVLPFFS